MMETKYSEKRFFVLRQALATIVMSLVMALAVTTVVQAQTYSSDKEKEKYYSDLITFMNTHVDPDFHRKGESSVNSEQRDILKQIAQEITKNCTTDYEKMRAIANYAADNFYYDYDYFYNGGSCAYSPYDVYLKKTTVCEGYANFCQEMLYLLDIPNMTLLGDNHKFNAAYDKDSKRWVIFDSTWMSRNQRWLNADGSEQWIKGVGRNEDWFDATPYTLMRNSNHEIFELEGIIVGDYIYSIYYDFGYDEKGNWNSVSPSVSAEMVNTAIVDAVIPESALGYTITEYYLSFKDNLNLKSVVIPENYKYLSYACFSGCKYLESIVFKGVPEGFGLYCFKDCIRLKEINLPQGTKYIGYAIFYGCKGLTEIEIPDSVEYIEGYAFSGCTGLEKIVIPNSVTKIDTTAFNGVNLRNFYIYCESGSYAEEFAKKYNFKYKIIEPAVDDYTGLRLVDDTWFYYSNGKVDTKYVGLTKYNNVWWYVSNGKLNRGYKGLTVYNYCAYSVKNGQLDSSVNGLKYCAEDGCWYNMKNGKQDKTYSGLVFYNNDWWYVTNGKLDKEFKGVTPKNGKLWFVRNGKLSRENGITQYNGNIYWITNGEVDTSIYALKYNGNDGKWYYFRQGVVDWSYNTLAYANNQWWYINNGVLDKGYTGLVEFRGQLWYVTEGKLDKAFVGSCVYNHTLYQIKNGIGTPQN